MYVVVASASVMVAAWPSRDVKVEVVRVLEVAVDMVMFGVNAIQGVHCRVMCRFLEMRVKLLFGNILVLANRVVRTHAHHMEDFCRVDFRLGWVVLGRKQPLQILLEVMTFEVVGHILITVVGMRLVGV